jgi:hypothetical protein
MAEHHGVLGLAGMASRQSDLPRVSLTGVNR